MNSQEFKPSYVLEKYLADTDLSYATREFYRCILNNYFRYLSVNRLELYQVEVSHLINYKKNLENLGKFPRTINKYMQVLNSFYKHLNTNGSYPNRFWESIKKVRIDNSFSRYSLTPDEVRQLLALPDLTTLKGKRDYLIILLLSLLGLRRCEAARLKINDVVFMNNQYWLRLQRKGEGKGTMKLIDEFVYKLIIEVIGERSNQSDYLFITHGNSSKNAMLKPHRLSQVVKEYMIKIGLVSTYYTAHSLRHTCANILISSGMPIEEVRVYMGHKSINTTQLYIKNLSYKYQFDTKGLNIIKKMIE